MELKRRTVSMDGQTGVDTKDRWVEGHARTGCPGPCLRQHITGQHKRVARRDGDELSTQRLEQRQCLQLADLDPAQT